MTDAPQPKSGGERRIKLPYVLAALFGFYAAVFAAMSLVDFPFSLPLLLIVLLMVGLPLGVVAAGVAFGVQLALRFRIPAFRWPPQVFVSIFIGTTFVVCAAFIASYPQFVIEGAAERTQALAEILPEGLGDEERAATLASVERFWVWYLTEIRNRSAEELTRMSPEVSEAARLIFEAYGDANLEVTEVTALRVAIEKVTPPLPSTAPRAATAPAGSESGN